MTAAISRHRWDLLAGLLLGGYGVAVGLAPAWPAKAILCAPMLLLPLAWWLLGGVDRWLICFLLAAWLLPPLPVAIGNSGPHLALLFAGAGLWIGFLRLPEWRRRLGGLAAAMLAFAATLCLSLPMALVYSGPQIAAASAARVLLFAISIFVFLYVCHGPGVGSPVLIPLLFSAAVASALFACIDFYFQFPAPAGYGPQFIWLDSGVLRRAQGLFYEASTLGNYCAFFLVMVATALFAGGRPRLLPLWALFAGGAVLAVALVLSYSRGSLVNVLVAFAVLLWLNRRRIRFARIVPVALALSVAAALVMAWIFPEFARAYWIRASGSAQYLFESPNAVLSGRLQSWGLLSDFLRSHPLYALLGVGYKTLPYSDFIGATVIADNTYLSTLVETGIGGLAALLILNAAILLASYRASRSGQPFRALLGTWMFCFWCGEVVQMFSGDLLTYWRVLPGYFCVLALAVRE